MQINAWMQLCSFKRLYILSLSLSLSLFLPNQICLHNSCLNLPLRNAEWQSCLPSNRRTCMPEFIDRFAKSYDQSNSSLDKEEVTGLACQITSPFNRKLGWLSK